MRRIVSFDVIVHLLQASMVGLFTAFSVVAHAEQSDDSALLQVRSQHGLNAVFGLPGPAARRVQTREWQLSIEHANQFIGKMANNEHMLLDGESTELTLRHRQRLSSCWQGELLLPFIQHHSGYFDRAIDDWHQFFGMPDAGRDEYEFDALSYSYIDDRGVLVTVETPQSGIGDVQFSVQRTLSCESTADTTGSEAIVRAGIKLPTGAAEELRGSGKADAYVDIQSPVWKHYAQLTSGVTLGVMYVGEADNLPVQRSIVAFGTFGGQYRLNQRYRLMLQFDWHTPFYRSALAPLGETSVVLTTGLRYLLKRGQTLELSISEDIAVETAPDIAVRLAWTYRPNVER